MTNNLQSKKVIEVVFNSEVQQVLLKVECSTMDSKKLDIQYRTKDEILKEDPKLLLYFYESHLQFKRRPNFQANKLKTV